MHSKSLSVAHVLYTASARANLLGDFNYKVSGVPLSVYFQSRTYPTTIASPLTHLFVAFVAVAHPMITVCLVSFYFLGVMCVCMMR